MQKTSEGQEDVYETFNILMRRKPKENNFKAVLETIRNLMNTECVVPNWLLDIILGYGDPGAAHYSKMKQPSAATMDFNDTFMSLDHLKTCFPDHEAIVATEDDVVTLAKPPFRLTFPDLEEDEEEEEEEKKTEKVKKKKKKGGKKRAAEKDSSEEPAKKKEKNENEEEVTEVTEKKEEPMEAGSEVRAIQRIPHKPKPKLIVQPYVVPSRGPYPFLIPKKNTVPFTPTQVSIAP
jgi:intron-binding protein aquarius